MFPSIFVPQSTGGLVQRKLPVTQIEWEIPLVPCSPDASGFAFGFGSGLTQIGVVQTSVAASPISLSATFFVPQPHDPWWTLIQVRAEVCGRLPGASAHAGLPARMPIISLLEVEPAQPYSVALTGSDTSVDATAYDAVHMLVSSFRSPVVHTTDPLVDLNPNNGHGSGVLELPSTQRFVCIQGEYSTNSQANSFYIRRLYGIWVAA